MKIIHIVGARPNFMKIAPILHQMRRFPDITNILVHTGQHYDTNMSEVFFRDLGIPMPDVNLGVGSGSHASQTAQIMLNFEPVIMEEKPDMVVVVGDVNSTIACGLVAVKLHVPIAHVEAGLRSFDRSMPEEINRILTDSISDLLFTPTESATTNLIREGVTREKIHFSGNVMVDSLIQALPAARSQNVIEKLGLARKEFALLTLHRVGNVDDSASLHSLLQTIEDISNRMPVVFPVHPRTVTRIKEAGLQAVLEKGRSIRFIEPQGYLDFLSLLVSARFVLTDSGGVQSEAAVLGVPCITLRENTEWNETISMGANRLVGSDPERILSEVERILSSEYLAPPLPAGWDGQAAVRIVDVLTQFRR